MARIKSALEIALERTNSVKSDKESINQYELKQQGKKLANQYLENPAESLASGIAKYSKEEQETLRQGIFDILVSQITLPAAKEDLARIEAVGKGLGEIINRSEFSELYGQLVQALSQYIQETEQFEKMITQQYAPKLRQKEEELSRRMGRQVKIDPFQDPEFINFYNQNMGLLRDRYQAAVDQVREEAVNFFSK